MYDISIRYNKYDKREFHFGINKYFNVIAEIKKSKIPTSFKSLVSNIERTLWLKKSSRQQ